MIGPIKTVGIYVEDQQKAIELYTQKLGFEVRRKEPMEPKAFWIEVAPPGAETRFVLYPKAMMPDWAQLKSSVVFHCPDVEKTCRRLEAAGVTIRCRRPPCRGAPSPSSLILTAMSLG